MRPRVRTAAGIVSALAVGAACLVALQPGLVMAAGTNADTVDGFHAVGCSATRVKRAGKLVATCASNGRLPNNIIAKAPDSAKLGGKSPTAYLLRSAIDTRTFSCGGSSMVPGDNVTEYGTDGPLVAGPGGSFRCNAVLPDGAVVTKASATVRNNDPTGEVVCALARSRLDIATIDFDTMATMGPAAPNAGDTVVTTTAITDPVINNATYTYRVSCRWDGDGTDGYDQGVFGARVTYQVSAANG
jgi:hypothetical protein